MQETRQAILNILKERGQVTIEELRGELKLTPATVLHHLNVLRGEGLVDMSGPKRHQTPGRPQHVYALTERASDYFPKNYVEFADLTLREIGDHAGLDELDSIMRGVARRMAADVPQLAPGEPMPKRLVRVQGFASMFSVIGPPGLDERIRHRLDVDVVKEKEVWESLAGAIASLDGVMKVASVIVAAAVVLGVMNTIFTLVQQRRREIAVLRSVGFGRRAVIGYVLSQSR